MAKGKWTRRLGRALRGVFRALDKTADRAANRPVKQIRHGKLEWGQDADGKPVHSGRVAYPTRPVTRQPVKWRAAYTHDDKEQWRAVFGSGVSVDFVTYPLTRARLEVLAHEKRHDMYGVYSDDWPLVDLVQLDAPVPAEVEGE
jgi:hypothetical protein